MSVILLMKMKNRIHLMKNCIRRITQKLKEIIDSIVCRLSEINDGGFEIDNQIK